MKLLNTFSHTLVSNKKSVLFAVSILAVLGTVIELLAGIWDAISHIMREPELFWTPPHIVVYTGVAMITLAAILGLFILITNPKNVFIKKGLKILIIGVILQITAGYADSISHDIYGVDGLVTVSHLVLEIGLLFSALGGFLVLSNIGKRSKTIHLAITSVFLSSAWIGFNLILLFGSVILCLPVYIAFSSGCAVL